MGKLFGNNGYLLAESENSIMGIKLGIIVSGLVLNLVSSPEGVVWGRDYAQPAARM